MIERIGELWLERTPAAPPGHGRRLLLVHGMWGGSWYWAEWARLFADAGWETWALNLRGHHGSHPVADLGRVGIGDYVADVLSCVRRLGDVVVIGHSMGGLVAQKVAEQAPLRAGVFLMSATPRWIPILRWPLIARLARYAGFILASRPFLPRREDVDALVFNNLEPVAREAAFTRLVPESARAARELALGRVAVDSARVRCPTLVVGAARDALTPPSIQRRIARKYGAVYRELPRHGHMPMLEPEAEAGARELLAWLARVAG